MKSFGVQPRRTSFRSPWQNGVAERWVGSGRRDILDHVIVLNARHLRRLMSEYVRYYHEDRTHLALAKGTPGDVKQQEAPMDFVRSNQPQGSAVGIVVTISQPELLSEPSRWG